MLAVGRGAGDDRCADTVDVDGFRAKPGDRELVEITGQPRCGSWWRKSVELVADWLASTPNHLNRCGPPEFGTGHLDGVGHPR